MAGRARPGRPARTRPCACLDAPCDRACAPRSCPSGACCFRPATSPSPRRPGARRGFPREATPCPLLTRCSRSPSPRASDACRPARNHRPPTPPPRAQPPRRRRKRDRRPVRRPRQRGIPRDLPRAERRAVAVLDLHQRRQRSCSRPRPTSACSAQLNSWIEQSRKFEGQPMSPETARAMMLLKLTPPMPPPKDPAKLAELTQIATQHGRHVRLRQVLHRRKAMRRLPRAGRTRGRAAQQPRLRRAARRLAGLAHDRAADAQGLRALRRTGQRRRARPGLRRHRRDVALAATT